MVERLSQNAALTTLLGDPPRLYDAVPPDAVFPFVTLGESRVKDYPGIDGAEDHTVRFRAFSRYGGRKEIKDIFAAIHISLHEARFDAGTNHLVNIRHVFTDYWQRPDMERWQGVLVFRAVTQPLGGPS